VKGVLRGGGGGYMKGGEWGGGRRERDERRRHLLMNTGSNDDSDDDDNNFQFVNKDKDWGWGIIVSNRPDPDDTFSSLLIEVLVKCEVKKNKIRKNKIRKNKRAPETNNEPEEDKWRIEDELPFDWWGNWNMKKRKEGEKVKGEEGDVASNSDSFLSDGVDDDGFTLVDSKKDSKKYTFKILTTKLRNVSALSAVRVNMPPSGGLRSAQRRNALGKSLNEVVRRFG